jgi:hypothetical protein
MDEMTKNRYASGAFGAVGCCNIPVRLKAVVFSCAPVAHLDRVLVSEAKGGGFESRRAHQTQGLRPLQVSKSLNFQFGLLMWLV